MKIIGTIIRNGISRGIPEGTKVPEKPKYCLSFGKTNCEELATRIGKFCACKIMEEKYSADLQALWDASPEWEDQRMIKSWLPDNAFVRNDDDEGVTVDGIYPLEGVEAKQVWKMADGGGAGWNDIDEKTYNYYKEHGGWVKPFLRLIPQPNSEQKKKNLCHDCDGSGNGRRRY